jgi:transcriptional regulator with XRE-family HTH domain
MGLRRSSYSRSSGQRQGDGIIGSFQVCDAVRGNIFRDERSQLELESWCTSELIAGGNVTVIIGDRLREMREEKKLSQGDIEKRTGLLRCYISRVENGHTVPAIETLEKLARALECPLYQLFYEGEEPPKLPNLIKRKSSDDIAWGSAGKDARYLAKLRRLLGKTEEGNRKLILYMAQKMANR